MVCYYLESILDLFGIKLYFYKRVEYTSNMSEGYYCPEGKTYRLTTYNKKPRIKFNAKDKKHCAIAAKFMRDYSWGKNGCPFLLEDPYIDIRSMILAKCAAAHLKTRIK